MSGPGNPYHGKDGKFSSGPGGADTGAGHNAGKIEVYQD